MNPTSPPATKLLLTSVCRPFGGRGEGDSVGAELFHAQITRAQGPFSHRQVIRVWALDYLAENLQAPTVTLHYPSEQELIAELRGGRYTHVGINFVVATFHKVRRMVPLIRRYAPEAKIILGGYGTVLPDEVLGRWSDAICREEGITFMRRLFDEPPAPLRHPHAPIPSVQVLGFQQRSVVGHVTAGLGCPNGCDFCCTSHFFDRKYVPLAQSGRELYEALMATRARARADGQAMESFIVIDEDFFLQRRRAQEFLDSVRDGGEALSLMGFGSIKGLSRFSAREIAEMGFDVIWNAFEGTAAGYAKQRGRPMAELYRELKMVGCAPLTSMIIGFPYQDEARIRAEFEQLMALEPSLTQCLIYFAFPGTPLHAQVVAEGRYREPYRSRPDLRRWDGFSMHYAHPHFADPDRVEVLQRELYREDYERLGPSLLRLARVWLSGHANLRDDPNPLLAARAERFREGVRAILPALSAAVAFAPNRTIRERAWTLRQDIISQTGALGVEQRAREAGAPLLYLGSLAARAVGVFQQPGLLRTEHRLPNEVSSQHTRAVFHLQGAPRYRPLPVLLEDLRDRWSAWRRRTDRAHHGIPPGASGVNTRATGMLPSRALCDDAPSAGRPCPQADSETARAPEPILLRHLRPAPLVDLADRARPVESHHLSPGPQGA